MAKSSSYFGLRTGSTKSLTFSVVDGKQITKDRVERIKNPRTFPQMTQRCVVATIGTAYAAMKSICNHSFEKKTAGMQCMREFMSENLKHIQISKEYDNGLFGFTKYQQAGLVPGSYIISKGSLPDACPDACITSVSTANGQVVVEVASGSGTLSIARSLGCRNFKDTCTIAIMYPKADGYYGFGAVRFTYKEADNVLESFSVSAFGDVAAATPAYVSDTLKVEVQMSDNFAADATVSNTYMAAITSRMVNGNWLRSNAQFDVTDATPTLAEAISTYPIGEERILNGGGIFTPSQEGSHLPDQGGSTAPDPNNQNGNENQNQNQNQNQGSLASPVISGLTPFEETTEVTITGPDGAEIRYTTDGSTPTSESSLYSEAVTLSETATVKAIAIKDGQTSEVASKLFTKGNGDSIED
ncbi:MAG: chitobiase/beta-hexosaminidase C-terminal domain-containing protein [Bacteroidaceae bacterium]|nr:chitobiase/beta-hexosaminidase C-terminal domain-containing protein [Bacteroidaceae bacterium]